MEKDLTVPSKFVSAHSRAIFVIVLLSIVTVYNIVDLIAMSKDTGLKAFYSYPPNLFILRLHQLGAFIYITTGISFLVWLHRVYRNMPAIGVQLNRTPGQAVGCWFIPIVNLYEPYLVVKDAYEASNPDSDVPSSSLRAGSRNSPKIALWWGFLLASGFINWIASIVYRGGGLDVFWTDVTGVVIILSNLISIMAALLAILVVRRIDERQEIIGKRFLEV